jgi:hypothetical protein
MEIIGYSERGVMNALFYGIALKQDNESMKHLLEKAGIEDNYDDYTVYSEFSLSDFGDPDMVIIADKKEGKKDVIFIEAKVSAGNTFKLKDQHDNHKKYIEQEEYKSGNSSNLFFQLRQKHYFFQTKGDINQQKNFNIPRLIKYYDRYLNKERRIGKNEVVLKFAECIKKCDSAHYVAIIPKSERPDGIKEEYGFDIHFIYWEDLAVDEYFGKYLYDTIAFNQTNNYNQILNSKTPKR